ncbi:MAG: NVEALA domain-containing protein [Paludibacter sp.]|nr:NVEALA domain-containing protein [Paludibacter sp.]
MKKKVFGVIAVVAIAVAVAFNVNLNMSKTNHTSMLALANVEALAFIESSEPNGTLSETSETGFFTTGFTKEIGWDWNMEDQCWMYMTSNTNQEPSDATYETGYYTITTSCCKPYGENGCEDYPVCEN